MKQHEIVNDVLEGMLGIGGIPTNESFYAEFDMRVRAGLGIPENAELATLRAQNAALVEALGGLLGGVNGGVGEFAFFASPEKIREAEAALKTARGE